MLEPPTHLRVELNEIEEDDVLSAMLNGQVEGVACVGLEYLIEQWGTHLSKVTGVQIVLGSVTQLFGLKQACVQVEVLNRGFELGK